MDKLTGNDVPEPVLADEEVDQMFASKDMQSPSHLQREGDDFCLMSRINSKRGQFAQRVLFKSGFKGDDINSLMHKSKSMQPDNLMDAP